MEECVGKFSIACSFRNAFRSVEYGFFWAFIGVYGPNSLIALKGLYGRS
jgi:hypothetical protein